MSSPPVCSTCDTHRGGKPKEHENDLKTIESQYTFISWKRSQLIYNDAPASRLSTHVALVTPIRGTHTPLLQRDMIETPAAAFALMQQRGTQTLSHWSSEKNERTNFGDVISNVPCYQERRSSLQSKFNRNRSRRATLGILYSSHMVMFNSHPSLSSPAPHQRRDVLGTPVPG